MFWLRNKKNIFLLTTFIWRPDILMIKVPFIITVFSDSLAVSLLKMKVFSSKSFATKVTKHRFAASET